MRYLAIVAFLVACSKKEPAGSTAGTASAGSGTASGSGSAKPAPTMTPEMFVAEPPAWTVEGVERGLWLSVDGGAFIQACRVDLGINMVKVGKLRDAAKGSPASLTCAEKGVHTVCSYAAPAPADNASWIFVADDDSDHTILMAVAIGTHDWAKLEPTLPAKKECPRPSQDPQ